MHACMHTRANTWTSVHICAYTHATSLRADRHTGLHASTFGFVHILTLSHNIYMYICVHMYTHVYIQVRVCIYIYISLSLSPLSPSLSLCTGVSVGMSDATGLVSSYASRVTPCPQALASRLRSAAPSSTQISASGRGLFGAPVSSRLWESVAL